MPFAGERLLMQVRPGGIYMPYDALEAREMKARGIPSRIDAVVQDPPSTVSEVIFGWAPEAADPNRPIRLGMQPREGAPSARSELILALNTLLAQAGIKPGDVLVNTPYGIGEDDYARAQAYMRYGFGAPSVMQEQVARVGNQGQLVPEMLAAVHPGFARKLKWIP